MHKSVTNLTIIEKQINDKILNKEIEKKINIIAVSKTFPIEDIKPLINYGHIHYGENKVQEAIEKWTNIKNENKNIKLHFIGKLQTNKVKYILPLFDFIHSLDNIKLAQKISLEQIKKNFKPKIFIQVNIGNEIQKGGINIDELESFIKLCKETYNLDIIGLMCIPPNDEKISFYFEELNKLNKQFKFEELSMGMSNDYILAINNGATFIRVGSKIFGERIK